MLYDKIMEVSKERNESISHLLEMSGIQRSNSKRLKNNNPTIQTLLKLSAYTGKSINWFLDEEILNKYAQIEEVQVNYSL